MEVNNGNSLNTICDGFAVLSMANNNVTQCNNNSVEGLRAAIVATQ